MEPYTSEHSIFSRASWGKPKEKVLMLENAQTQ